MLTNTQVWWHLSRASGIVSWVLLTLTVVWGLLLTTRLLREVDRPAWLLDLHRWLGTLTWVTTGVHLATLFADSYVEFSIADLLVPFSASWKTGPVAWGIVGLYLIVLVQATSRWMKQMPRRVWRAMHFASYPAFAFVTLHAFLAGTDASVFMFQILGIVLITSVTIFTLMRVQLAMRAGTTRRTSAGGPTPLR